nr:helix-turn-helix domain-containing protein [uncultured Cupriavidus sp.]
MAVFFSQWEALHHIAFDELCHDCPELFGGMAEGVGAASFGARQQAAADASPPLIAPRERVLEVLAECGGNRQQAAQRLGVSRATLWRWEKAATAASATPSAHALAPGT